MENSIEEDIKIIENILHKGYTMSILHPSTNIKESEIKALEHILSDYKRVLEINEVLLKENEELKEYKKIAELTKISCCTAQNCEALNNAIRERLENQKLKNTNT